jgi:hypothetical protein
MRNLTLISVTLAYVLGLSAGAQAVTLSVSTGKSNYNPGETIVVTVRGIAEGAVDTFAFGRIEYDPTLVSPNGGQTQTALERENTILWSVAPLFVDTNANTQDSFAQLTEDGLPHTSTQELEAIMTFTVGAVGGATGFSFEAGSLNFFGFTTAAPAGVSINPAALETRTFSVLGTSDGVGWSLGVTVGGNPICEVIVPTGTVAIGQGPAAFATAFVNAINGDPACAFEAVSATLNPASVFDISAPLGFAFYVADESQLNPCTVTGSVIGCSFNPTIIEVISAPTLSPWALSTLLLLLGVIGSGALVARRRGH